MTGRLENISHLLDHSPHPAPIRATATCWTRLKRGWKLGLPCGFAFESQIQAGLKVEELRLELGSSHRACQEPGTPDFFVSSQGPRTSQEVDWEWSSWDLTQALIWDAGIPSFFMFTLYPCPRGAWGAHKNTNGPALRPLIGRFGKWPETWHFQHRPA